jgi:hypothetical protein
MDGCEHRGFRVVHYSVQHDHIHLVVEAPSADALSRGVRALSIRLARRINPVFSQRGRLFADRYHAHVLHSPREVRNALRYVLGNARRHATPDRGRHLRQWIDPYSSGLWFDGWQGLRGAPMSRPVWPSAGDPGADAGSEAFGPRASPGAGTRGEAGGGRADPGTGARGNALGPRRSGAGSEQFGPLGRDDPRFMPGARPETASAGSHLLIRGWRRGGLIPTDAVPGGRPGYGSRR